MDPIRCDVTNRCPFLSLSPSPSFECFVMGLWRPGRSDSSATGPNNKNLMKARAVLLYTFRPIQMGKMKLEKKKKTLSSDLSLLMMGACVVGPSR